MSDLKEIYNERYTARKNDNLKRDIRLYRKLFEILPFKKKAGTHLDLGCGKGFKTIGFSEKLKSTLAIDLSDVVIEQCKKQFPNHNQIEFRAMDAMQLDDKFDVISAFGFSLFNRKDQNILISKIEHFVNQNLEPKGSMIIGSRTDFSGTGEESWYYFTKRELNNIVSELNEKQNISAQIYFPHKKSKNYLGFGIMNFFKEIFRFFFKKHKVYFILLDKVKNVDVQTC